MLRRIFRAHVARRRPKEPRIQVFHSTAPTCTWSWGYEAVFNRLKMVYGDRIDIHVQVSCVYEDFDEYLKHYELTFEGLKEWTEEAIGIMGIPLNAEIRRDRFPPSQLPASMAAMAAKRQGTRKGERFLRAVERRACVEGLDVSPEPVLVEAAKEAGLDVERFKKDLRDHEGLVADYRSQGDHFYHMPLGFYNVIVTDGKDRMVILDYAFDPAVVEEAIDYLARGTLPKREPKDVLPYLRQHGPTPLREIERVFRLSRKAAERELKALAKAGKARTIELAGAPHWLSA